MAGKVQRGALNRSAVTSSSCKEAGAVVVVVMLATRGTCWIRRASLQAKVVQQPPDGAHGDGVGRQVQVPAAAICGLGLLAPNSQHCRPGDGDFLLRGRVAADVSREASDNSPAPSRPYCAPIRGLFGLPYQCSRIPPVAFNAFVIFVYLQIIGFAKKFL